MAEMRVLHFLSPSHTYYLPPYYPFPQHPCLCHQISIQPQEEGYSLKFLKALIPYNLVIPALPPYDNDGLSLALKEHFNWSMPVYVQAPILDSNTTTPDVQILDAYSNEICQAIGNQYVPTELTLFAEKLLSIVGDMRTVLTRSAGADMQLVLHMLDSINTNLSSIQGIDYDGFIAAQRKKLEGTTTFFEDAFD